MKFVEPFRDKAHIQQVKDYFIQKWDIRNLLLIELGINSALRWSDLVRIQLYHVYNEDWSPKTYFHIKEKKTSKTNKITVPPRVQETLKLYRERYLYIFSDYDHYLFFNRHKDTFSEWTQPISRSQAWRIISKTTKKLGIEWNYGTHSLRKTRGYHARKEWVDLSLIQYKLNHSNPAVTMRYLGITFDELHEICNTLNF